MAISDEEKNRRYNLVKDAYVRKYGDAANQIQPRMHDLKKRQGGVTPVQLQELVWEWGSVDHTQNVAASGKPEDMHKFLYIMALELEAVKVGKADPRDFAVQMYMGLMQYAHAHQFDLMEGAYETLDLTLTNAITRAEKLDRQ